MNRGPTRLEVFALADALVVDVNQATRSFPIEERFGLQAQIRRAAVSVAANIVEGCARESARDYRHFLIIARASAAETKYLLHVARRLELLPEADHAGLEARYRDVLRGMQKLTDAVAVLLSA